MISEHRFEGSKFDYAKAGSSTSWFRVNGNFWFVSTLIKLLSSILVTASGMPTALEIKPMPNADGIRQH